MSSACWFRLPMVRDNMSRRGIRDPDGPVLELGATVAFRLLSDVCGILEQVSWDKRG